jgi:hypothetical protein
MVLIRGLTVRFGRINSALVREKQRRGDILKITALVYDKTDTFESES